MVSNFHFLRIKLNNSKTLYAHGLSNHQMYVKTIHFIIYCREQLDYVSNCTSFFNPLIHPFCCPKDLCSGDECDRANAALA